MTSRSQGRKKVWRSLADKNRTPEERRRLHGGELARSLVGQEPEEGLVSPPSLLSPKGRKKGARKKDRRKNDRVGRRTFLKASTAAAAAAGLGGCIRRPVENILPYSQGPEYIVPGVPMHFASVTQRRGDALGILVTSHEGRPTKIEGNPEHPASGGATDTVAQASLMDLYDLDRSERPAKGGEESSWSEFEAAYRARLEDHTSDRGAGLRFLLPPTISPTVIRARNAVLERFPQAKFHNWAGADTFNGRAGTQLAFNQALTTVYNFPRTRVILSLDSDFLGTEPGSVRASRGFAQGRRIEGPDSEMSRLYVVEPSLTITGGGADHRLPMAARDIKAFLIALARDLRDNFNIDLGSLGGQLPEVGTDAPELWLSKAADGRRVGLAADLAAAAGLSVVVVGSRQPPEVHALAAAINRGLGNEGQTLAYVPAADADQAEPVASIAELVSEIGSVRTLVVLGGNPVYDAPADLDFGTALSSVEMSFHLASHRNETSAKASWHCNEAHELEAWGDAQSFDGIVALQQPLISPLWGSVSTIELLGIAANERNWRGYYMVRKTFRENYAAGQFEQTFRRALHSGFVFGSQKRPVAGLEFAASAVAAELPVGDSSPLAASNLEINFAPCTKMEAGSHANNLWLLEVPEPMSKLCWDNAALMAPNTADALSLRDGDMVRLSAGDRNVELPVAVQPGQAEFTVTLHLGWGRAQEFAGRYAKGDENHGGGFDVNPLRTTDHLWFRDGANASKSGGRYLLVRTQEHNSMVDEAGFDRPLAIDATLEEYRANPEWTQFLAVDMAQGEGLDERGRPAPGAPLWQAVDYSDNYKWGMAIDLSTCSGCNACVIACQAENNIPNVGKRQVARGREMYWLRLDRYYVGDESDNPQVAIQPVSCQHCEEAPCENVCPVNATAHSPDGMNDMAYNRCIGTRYCANNCPYKVRRFNYLTWHGYVNNPDDWYSDLPETHRMVFNPNVTVRMRGVMEKCSYCVQRVQQWKIDERRLKQPLSDGDIQSACQQVCASNAIVFGDLNDPDSAVARANRQGRHYKLLSEVGARPRTTFLGKVRNINPDFEEAEA
ncbi:MAG: 4Fe-4S dicluster domain-containing protein [Myxococcota bacterium]